MLTLDNTQSGESANSYVDVAYADDYFSAHLSSTKQTLWAGLTDDQKTNALIQGCYMVEQLKFTIPTNTFPFDARLQYDNLRHTYYYSVPQVPGVAIKYTALQALQFPRNIDMKSTGVFIPEKVMMAQCEQAIYLCAFDDSTLATSLQGVTSDVVQVSGLTVSQKITPGGTAMSPIAMQFLNPYLLRTTGTRLQRA